MTAAEGLASPFQVAAQALDQQLANDDRCHHPRQHAGAGDGHEVNIATRDDHLVDQGVELTADRRVLIEQAGEVSVEGIGGRGDEEQEEGPGVALLRDQGEHAQGQDEPAEG